MRLECFVTVASIKNEYCYWYTDGKLAFFLSLHICTHLFPLEHNEKRVTNSYSRYLSSVHRYPFLSLNHTLIFHDVFIIITVTVF